MVAEPMSNCHPVAAFGVYAITLSMAALFNQIIFVIVLIVCTVLTGLHVGEDPYTIGTKLRLEVDLGDPE
jgi:hypothetical protein